MKQIVQKRARDFYVELPISTPHSVGDVLTHDEGFIIYESILETIWNSENGLVSLPRTEQIYRVSYSSVIDEEPNSYAIICKEIKILGVEDILELSGSFFSMNGSRMVLEKGILREAYDFDIWTHYYFDENGHKIGESFNGD